jgi:hypothetical protein
MPDLNPPMPVWGVKFFRDLRSQAPTRIGYVSRASEAEVEKLAHERMADEEACRVEICPRGPPSPDPGRRRGVLARLSPWPG